MSQQFSASPDKLTLAIDCTADFETVVNRRRKYALYATDWKIYRRLELSGFCAENQKFLHKTGLRITGVMAIFRQQSGPTLVLETGRVPAQLLQGLEGQHPGHPGAAAARGWRRQIEMREDA